MWLFLPSFSLLPSLSLSPSIHLQLLPSLFLKWLFNWDKSKFTCSFKMQYRDIPYIQCRVFPIGSILGNFMHDHNQGIDTDNKALIWLNFLHFICTYVCIYACIGINSMQFNHLCRLRWLNFIKYLFHICWSNQIFSLFSYNVVSCITRVFPLNPSCIEI